MSLSVVGWANKLVSKELSFFVCAHTHIAQHTLYKGAEHEGSMQFATRADVTGRVQLILHA